jgi:hypothetical protein
MSCPFSAQRPGRDEAERKSKIMLINQSHKSWFRQFARRTLQISMPDQVRYPISNPNNP